MKSMTQEEKVINMMKRPIPKKKVGIIKLKMIREGTAVYGTQRFHEAKEAADIVIGFGNDTCSSGGCSSGRGECLCGRYQGFI